MLNQVQRIVDFANSPLHAGNWRERVAAMSVEPVITLATPTTGPVVGVDSLDEARALQSDLQDLLNRIVAAAEAGTFQQRVELTDSINARLKIQVVYQPHATENRLYAIWKTDASSVLESLYIQLAQSLVTDDLTAYGHCPTCGKFLHRRTRHGQQYCSDSCRALASFRRRRDGKDDPSARVPTKAPRTRGSRRSS